MTTLHEDANVEEAEQAAEEEEVGKVSSEAVADKCQAASRLQPKEHHLEQQLQHATVTGKSSTSLTKRAINACGVMNGFKHGRFITLNFHFNSHIFYSKH